MDEFTPESRCEEPVISRAEAEFKQEFYALMQELELQDDS